jgi:Carboxypeptidase regulatory-like domain/Two component regulator propeller
MLPGRRSKRGIACGAAVRLLVILLGLIWFLSGCDNGGSSGSLSAPSEPAAPAPQLEQAAVHNLLGLQRTAVLQEDIDRLQALLHGDGGTFGDSSFLAFMADTFQRIAILDLQYTEVTLQLTHEPFTATFRETLSVEDPMTLEQRTHSVQTTWRLVKQTDASGTVTILIGAVTQEGTRFEVATRGQVQAGIPVAVEVRETSGTFAIASVEVEVPDTGVRTSPRAEGSRFVGSFTPPGHPQPQALQVHIRDAQGEEITIAHRYRLRVPADGAVERVDGTEGVRLFALAVAPDGTAWAGGDSIFSGTAGTIVQVAADGQTVLFTGQPFLALLPAEATARIEDLAIDQLGRVHALFIARVGGPEGVTTTGVVGNGDVVLDPQQPDLFCQTVNAFVRDPQTGEPQFDPAYPFRVPEPQTGQLRPSPSTRMLAAGGGDIWLFGSDGGVARVADGFHGGECPEGQVAVSYAPIFRREESGLLSNTVPALEVGRDGALWFGTAFGLARLLQGQFIPVPFDPALSLRGNVATLEAFFQEVAQAIFTARPVSAVSIGGVSFVNAFGSPLIKEDLIFSLAEDGQGRLWVGTLGGGIRCIEVIDGVPRQTLHLTRADGLGSNLIFGLAVGPDGAVWAATEEGVSRLQELNGVITMTNFSASDGLALPVRDVAVSGDGTVWLASDGGLFRLTTAVGMLRGVVQDAAGRPVVGAEVRLLGTPFRTVTDAEGRFALANLPPGEYQLLIDGSLAVGGPFTAVVGEVEVAVAEQTLPPVGVVPRPPAARLVMVRGDAQTGTVGQPLPTPLEVAVQEAAGRGIAGVAVTFTVTEGSADLASEVVVTDADGLARNTVAITAAGTLQVAASTEGTAPVVFTLTGVGEGVSGGPVKPRLIPVSGNNQSAEPGQALPEPLVVRLEDQFGNPIVGQLVRPRLSRGRGR